MNKDLGIKLKAALEEKGIKVQGDKTPVKHAFLNKKEINKLKWVKSYQLEDGRSIHIRVF